MMKRIVYIFLLFCSMAVLMLSLLPLYRCAVPVQLVFSVQAESPATLTVTPGMEPLSPYRWLRVSIES